MFLLHYILHLFLWNSYSYTRGKEGNKLTLQYLGINSKGLQLRERDICGFCLGAGVSAVQLVEWVEAAYMCTYRQYLILSTTNGTFKIENYAPSSSSLLKTPLC